MKNLLLIINCTLLAIGNCGGPLISRLYFLHGGKMVWLSCWLETGGWPIMLIPLIASYINRRKTQGSNAKLIFITPYIFCGAAVMGVLTGIDDYIYAYGVSKLPVSTSALIIASQLAFTAGFSYLIVKQKFTAYSINAIVLLTIGAGVLALGSNSDLPEGESKKDYVGGFVMTLAAAVLYGFVLPMVEFIYKKASQAITYTLVLEIQMVISFFATAFATVGMLIDNDFKDIPREAKKFELGESNYFIVIAFSAIIWQAFFLGAIGVIFCATSLLSGILIAVTLPVTEFLGFIFYHESFQGQKIVCLILSLWGFVSYLYGEKKQIIESQQKSPRASHAS